MPLINDASISERHKPENVNHKHKEQMKPLDKLAVVLTSVVGTMYCAFAFAALALISLPDAIRQGRQAIISWIAQTFLQLVLLSVIMVGQNIQSHHSQIRADEEYKTTMTSYRDLEHILAHLNAQDEELLKQTHLIQKLMSEK